MTSESYQVRDDLLYSTEHEWLHVEGGLARVGLTDYAQHELGDVVFVELPKPGTVLSFMAKLGEVESVKVASEIFSPVSGEVAEINGALESEPELVNKDPYGRGWLLLVRIDDRSELDRLMTPDAYRQIMRRVEGKE